MKKLYLLCTMAVMFFTTASVIGQGKESFSSSAIISGSSYSSHSWTGDNGQPWTASGGRADQNLTGKAMTIRPAGTLGCATIPNGIGSLKFNYKYAFTGNAANLSVKVNGISVAEISVPSTATATVAASIPNINVSGTFSFEISQTIGSANSPRVTIDDIEWTAFNPVPCVAPAATGALSFDNVLTNSMDVAFVASSPVADKYLAFISTAPFTGTPVNGTSYISGQTLGNGTVVYLDADNSFTASGLTQGTNYYFTVFAQNSNCSGGPLYAATASSGSQATIVPAPCVAPVQTVTNLSFPAISSTSIGGSFTAATDANTYLVCISTNSSLGFTPTNGTSYAVGATAGSGTVIGYGTSNTFNKSGLTPSTQYYITVFAANATNCTGGPLYNASGVSGTATTTAATNTDNYYSTVSVTDACSTLKTKLNTIISSNFTARSYGDLWTQYAISDIKPREVGTGSANVIWDIYSDIPGPANDPYNFTPVTDQCGSGGSNVESDCYNREHSVPQSWFIGGTGNGPGTDYLHIFPTDKKVNADRGNFIFGEVSGGTSSLNGSKLGASAIAGFTGNVFEPINEYKGDIARAFLYFVTRYQSNIPGWVNATNGQAFANSTYPSVTNAYLNLMIKWANQDPVSQKELDRNDAAFSFQGNRNPFIDHPEYVGRVWNSSCPGVVLPVEILVFKGNLNGNKVKLDWEVGSELNLQQYEVERSVNGTDFTKVGTVKATNLYNYSFNDDVSDLSGRRLYYRIKKVDTDGQFKYSLVFTIHVPLNLQFSVYPNPVVNDFVKVQFAKATLSQTTIQVMDIAGRVYKQVPVASGAMNTTIDLQNVPAGMYLLKLVQEGNTVMQKIQIL